MPRDSGQSFHKPVAKNIFQIPYATYKCGISQMVVIELEAIIYWSFKLKYGQFFQDQCQIVHHVRKNSEKFSFAYLLMLGQSNLKLVQGFMNHVPKIQKMNSFFTSDVYAVTFIYL